MIFPYRKNRKVRVFRVIKKEYTNRTYQNLSLQKILNDMEIMNEKRNISLDIIEKYCDKLGIDIKIIK
jgi:transcriptional regulator NrdR family protein